MFGQLSVVLSYEPVWLYCPVRRVADPQEAWPRMYIKLLDSS